MSALSDPETLVNDEAPAHPHTTQRPARIPVWSWTDAVAESGVPPLTKLVCLNIARYLSSAGKGWRITIKQQMADTGLSNRSLATHLENAEQAGLLVREREHDKRGHVSGTLYTPMFPHNVELAREPAQMCGNLDEPSSPRQPPDSDEPRSRRRSRLDEPPSREGGSRQDLPKDKKAFHPPVVPQQAGGPRPTRTRLPKGWTLPDDEREWAKQHAPQQADAIDAAVSRFVAYYASRGTRRATRPQMAPRSERHSGTVPGHSTAGPVEGLRIPEQGQTYEQPRRYHSGDPVFVAWCEQLEREGDADGLKRVRDRGWVPLCEAEVRRVLAGLSPASQPLAVGAVIARAAELQRAQQREPGRA